MEKRTAKYRSVIRDSIIIIALLSETGDGKLIYKMAVEGVLRSQTHAGKGVKALGGKVVKK